MKTYKMNLTEKERNVINAMRESNDIDNDIPGREEIIDRYMEMDDKEFIEQYAKIFGDDTILAVLQDTFESDGKWNVLFDVIGEDVIDDLFESYVSVEYRRQLFLDSQDRFELCSQLVNAIHPSCNF
jgi:hypothetical protein